VNAGNLTLNEEQLIVLEEILSRVGGPWEGPRGHASQILDQVLMINHRNQTVDRRRYKEQCKGSIYFD
jgi:hypothetical protein